MNLRRSSVLLALTTLLVAVATTPASAATVQITPPASGVTASTDDGNVPGNVVDDDYDTRWSGNGDGAWLQLDLGAVRTVSHIKVAVYKGDQRRNVFQLQYWNGTDWVTVYDGQSDGTTTGLQTFDFTDVQTSKVRYVGHGYVSNAGTAGTWNSVTEVEIWAPASSGGGGGSSVPASVLDLTNWKITLPTGSSGSPTEIKQPDLATYSIDPYFLVNGTGVQFRAPVNGVTTSGSSYPRSELREMTSNGTANASWSSTSGTHTMVIDEAITATPAVKPHVVAGQIHDADDDVLVIRLEGTTLFVDHNGTHGPNLTTSYVLGTRFTVKFEVSGGHIKVYYNGTLADDYAASTTGNYFKAGAYTQANCTNSAPCAASNYGEVQIYALTVTHT